MGGAFSTSRRDRVSKPRRDALAPEYLRGRFAVALVRFVVDLETRSRKPFSVLGRFCEQFDIFGIFGYGVW